MKTRTQVAIASCLGLGLALLPHAAQAQAVYGSVYGTVTDATGAAVPNATVSITDEAKGITVTTTSNDSGGYSVEHLIPDLYTLKVEAPGFKGFQTTHLQVLADTSPKVDAPLQTGGASETINVNADAVPQLKTDRADVATTFDTKTVDDLPIQGRNFTSLQLLLPGAQQLGWSHAASENPQASQQIQIDGQAFGGVAYELDGTDNQDPILGIIVVNPALDAITEAKIATQNFDAEFGKAVSAVVTVQTKSGSNNFHGSAYDYRRSNANLARNPFAQFPTAAHPGNDGLVPPGLYNEFGGSIGGPILKDRAFFFGDYQGQRQKVGTSATQTVPSRLATATCLGQEVGPSGIPGCDFSEYQAALGAQGIIYQADGLTPYPGNVIPAAQLSQQSLALLRLLQPYAPNSPGQFNGLRNNYSASGTGGFNADQWDVRLDGQVTSKIHAFARFSRFTDTLTGATDFGPAGGAGFGINNFGGTSVGANDSTAAGADFAINSTLLSDFRVGYYRYNIATSKYDQTVPFASQLGIPGLNTTNRFTGGAPSFNITEVGNFGAPNANNNSNAAAADAQYGSGLNVNRCNCALAEHEDQYQVVNNWTKILGNHSVKFGADLRYARNLRVPSDSNRTGELQFATGPTSSPTATQQGGLGFATFVLGDVTNLNRYVSTSTNAKEFQKRTFFYAQDTWRATPNLTINAGLRWELYFPETVNGKGNGALLHLNTGYISVAEYGNIPSNLGWSLSPKALSPRIGVAYQLNPKTVLRAGYGRSFDIGVFGSIFGHVVTQNIPVLANQQITSTGGPTSFAFNLADGPTPFVPAAVPANGLLPNPGYAVNTRARPDSLRLPTLDAWNLSVQRSINPTLSLTIAYVGNKGTHTLSAGDGNNTNPNEAAIDLPAQFSSNGQTLHYDPKAGNGISANNGTANQTLLGRYYGGSLPACQSSGYNNQNSTLPAGACGWTNGVAYYGDDQDTHFNALQITLAKQLTHGLSFNGSYAWQRSINFNSSFATWSRTAVKGRDDSNRENELIAYGNYTLPFGRNHRFGGNAPGYVNEIIGDWQVSPVVNWSSGLPFTVSYAECNASIPGDAPCYVNGDSRNLPVNIGKFDPVGHRRLAFNGTTTPLTTAPFNNFTAAPLDTIGSAGRNGKFGPNFFATDASLQKNFPIREDFLAQFRVDAYNVFNHINAGNPGSGNVDQGPQYITGLAPSQFPTRQLQFSLRLQF